MEGNYKMVKRFFLIFCLVSAFLQSCTPIQVTEKEIIGTWVASDGGILSLKKDRTFTLKGFNPKFWNWDDSISSIKVDGKGEWEIKYRNDRPFLQLHFIEVRGKPIQFYNQDIGKYENTGCEFPMDIMGSDFPFYKKAPWILFVYEEYDGGDLYEFSLVSIPPDL